MSDLYRDHLSQDPIRGSDLSPRGGLDERRTIAHGVNPLCSGIAKVGRARHGARPQRCRGRSPAVSVHPPSLQSEKLPRPLEHNGPG